MKFKKMICEVFHSLWGNILYIIAFLIPKQKNIWVFGGLLGEGYNDNSKYFFEYINKNKKDIFPVWISQNSSVISDLRRKGYKAYPGYSLKGGWAAMRAGVAVISHSRVRDLKPFAITPQVKFIQLWHGIPLKKIEFDDTVFFNKPDMITKLKFAIMHFISPAFRRKFDMLIACSMEDAKHFASAFRVEQDKIKITGYPRNDIVVETHNRREIENSPKSVLYVPTFRGDEESDFDLFESFGFNYQKISAFMVQRNMELFIKLHPYNRPTERLLNNIRQVRNITFYEENDIYMTLGSFDILITDFSSIYFDFLLLDKPIIFAPFDMEGYLGKDRKLYYRYDDVTPGPKAYNWDDVMNSLTLLNKTPDAYCEERHALKNRFHCFQDAEACERVYQEIIRLP